jgi:regulator of sigma E protease
VTTVLAFLLVLGVLIFVHELGHFLVARWYGVRVLTFSLGFGPKMFKFTRGGTEYCISAIPLGGYVKMAGETAQDEREGAPDEFLSKSKWVRFQVYLAGPAMNVLLAVIALTVVLADGADVPKASSIIGSVDENSVAAGAGIQPGDRVISANGQPLETWEDLYRSVLPRADQQLSLVIERAGERRTITVVPASEGKYEIGQLGVRPVLDPHITRIFPGTPAERAGLRRGDRILSVAGRKLTFEQAVTLISARGPDPLVIEIERDGAPMAVTVTPEGKAGSSKIGIHFFDTPFEHIDPTMAQAVRMSLKENWDSARLIGRTLREIVTGETPVKKLMGPLAIADLSGSAAQLGLLPLLGLMAGISLNLALLNLMPVPVLDGGQILILALEGIARRDISLRVKERIAVVGAVAILLLMVVVLYNDIARLLR